MAGESGSQAPFSARNASTRARPVRVDGGGLGNMRAGQSDRWTPAWFRDQGLHQLMGTIRYSKAA